MILIGSRAALLGGVLAPWRDGAVKDFDLVCRFEEGQELAALVGLPLVTHAPGRAHIALDPLVDIDLWHPSELEAMEALCPERVEIEIAGEPIRVRLAPLEVLWSTLYLTAGCAVRHHEKSFRDMLHYDDLARAGGRLHAAHHALAMRYRERSVAFLRTRFATGCNAPPDNALAASYISG